jgi:hypothetical protein
MFFQLHNLINILICFIRILIFAVRKGNDFEMIVFVLIEKSAEFFHKLKALFAKISMLFENHVLLNGLNSIISVKDDTN